MVLEASRYLGCQLLCDSDIFSMANSLELRVPLVDKIVAESLAIVSDELFLNFKGIPKPLLVASVADLPSELVCRKKMGFAVPFNAWLRIDEWHPKSDLLNREVFRRVDNLFQKSKLHWSRRWALEVLDTYANQ
jgi:asparagine synthase (glutamine-hydrolysing)